MVWKITRLSKKSTTVWKYIVTPPVHNSPAKSLPLLVYLPHGTKHWRMGWCFRIVSMMHSWLVHCVCKLQCYMNKETSRVRLHNEIHYIPFLSLLLSFLALRVLPFGRVEEVPNDEDCLKNSGMYYHLSMLKDCIINIVDSDLTFHFNVKIIAHLLSYCSAWKQTAHACLYVVMYNNAIHKVKYADLD